MPLYIPLTNSLLLAAKQEPYKKAYLFTKNIGRIFWKKLSRLDQQAEKDKTERVLVLGRRTREEIVKWNQMTALRFQTGEKHPTSPASLWGQEEWTCYQFCQNWLSSELKNRASHQCQC